MVYKITSDMQDRQKEMPHAYKSKIVYIDSFGGINEGGYLNIIGLRLVNNLDKFVTKDNPFFKFVGVPFYDIFSFETPANEDKNKLEKWKRSFYPEGIGVVNVQGTIQKYDFLNLDYFTRCGGIAEKLVKNLEDKHFENVPESMGLFELKERKLAVNSFKGILHQIMIDEHGLYTFL